MFANYVTSLIRTGAALLAGWLLTLPLAHPVLTLLGFQDASPATKEKLVAALTGVLTAAWYAAVHALEKRYPAASWLLGSNQQPTTYSRPTGPFAAGPGAVPAGVSLNPQATIGGGGAITYIGSGGGGGSSYTLPTSAGGSGIGGVKPDTTDPFMEGGGANPDAPAGTDSGPAGA